MGEPQPKRGGFPDILRTSAGVILETSRTNGKCTCRRVSLGSQPITTCQQSQMGTRRPTLRPYRPTYI